MTFSVYYSVNLVQKLHGFDESCKQYVASSKRVRLVFACVRYKISHSVIIHYITLKQKAEKLIVCLIWDGDRVVNPMDFGSCFLNKQDLLLLTHGAWAIGGTRAIYPKRKPLIHTNILCTVH